MTTHSPNHLKPGQIVQHPEKGHGIVGLSFSKQQGIEFVDKDGVFFRTFDLTSWEPAETLPAGHVAIRTDDLDLNHLEGVRALWLRVQRLATDPVAYESYEEWAAANNSRCTNIVKPGHVQVRVDDLAGRIGAHSILETRAWVAWQDWAERQTESHNEPATSETVTDSDAPNLPTVGDGCECWVTPEHMWTTHYGAVEPGSQVECNPDCPKHGERPVGVVRNLGGRVGLFRHPDVPGNTSHCDLDGEWKRSGCPFAMEYHFVLDYGSRFETVCPDGTVTPQPEHDAPVEPVRLMHPEPTQRAAKASIYFEFIGPARLLRESSGSWVDQYGKTWTWDEADAAGSLVLGWGDDEDDADEPAKLSHPEPTQRGAKASYITWKGERRIRLIRTGCGEEPWISENGLPWSWDERRQEHHAPHRLG